MRSGHGHPESERRRLPLTSLPSTVRWSSEGQVVVKEASGKEKEVVEEEFVVEEDAVEGKYTVASSHCRLRRGELGRRGCEILQTAARCGRIRTAMTRTCYGLVVVGLWHGGAADGRAAACCGVQGAGSRVRP
jgi:hypothetical protein